MSHRSRSAAESPTSTIRSTTPGERYVVRIGEDIPVHGVYRASELAAARAAHAAGISPEIVHAEPGALVMRWVDGCTLEPAEVREPARLERVLETVRRCHRDVPPHFRGATSPIFWVFQVVRDYARTLHEDGSRMTGRLEELLARASRLGIGGGSGGDCLRPQRSARRGTSSTTGIGSG